MAEGDGRPYVLVIEDSEPNATLLCRFLRLDGYVVDSAGDGDAALETIARRTPDLILLDSHLPGVSGLEICQILRSRPATRLTPIIFLTGMDTSDLAKAAIEAGATQFLAKPYDTQDLRARVRELLQIKRPAEASDAVCVFCRGALTAHTESAASVYYDCECPRCGRFRIGKTLERRMHVRPGDDFGRDAILALIAAANAHGYWYNVSTGLEEER